MAAKKPYGGLKNNSIAIIKFVKDNPGSTSVDVAKGIPGIKNTTQAASALAGLWEGRYLMRHKNSKKNVTGMKLWEYSYKTDTPRGKYSHKVKRRLKLKSKSKPSSATPKIVFPKDRFTGDILIMVPVKANETLLLTLAEARALADNLQAFLTS